MLRRFAHSGDQIIDLMIQYACAESLKVSDAPLICLSNDRLQLIEQEPTREPNAQARQWHSERLRFLTGHHRVCGPAFGHRACQRPDAVERE
jgi:hypothetical protein